ncbi:hypothetical protein COCCADRAFT_85308 [Bipolaris zeicola 26-R-13]|uniref:Uncharacterized protein n=1 Tax=Cochliobolus carbonum (strain 26-R-13) TaxID=930089 RepID=W6YDA4_COCC2|nr:uncharacterized protein COCCADRAFT_85308 [Bipolaris zeicola 26-R-13]EUC37497.1 hypothetical protein COCCADRAFT_85308 [Bipolaris zeicola 26-R-13]
MAGLLAKTTGLRSWWGEGAVIAASMRASRPAARQAGTAPTAGATQQPAQGGRSTGGAFHASYLAGKKKAISPQRSRQTAVSSGSQSLREDSGWRLGTSNPLEFCRNKMFQSNTKTAPPPPWAVSPIHYSNHI